VEPFESSTLIITQYSFSIQVVILSELNKEIYYMPLMCLKLESIEVVFYFNTSF